MKANRHWYFVLSFSLSLVAMFYCYLVYQSGQHGNIRIGADFLSGVPNYYFFYIIILPFIGTGVFYLALENKYIRFFRDISNDLF